VSCRYCGNPGNIERGLSPTGNREQDRLNYGNQSSAKPRPVTLPDPKIVAVLVQSSRCVFCDAQATKCLGDEWGRLFPCCDRCFGNAWPLFEVPMAEKGQS